MTYCLTRRLGHPYEPILAVSGIDDTIKIFSPDGRAQDDATNGINISQSSNDSSGYVSSTQGVQGLSSRKRMQDQYSITNHNDMIRHGGIRVMESFFPVCPSAGSIGTVQIYFTGLAELAH